MARVITTGEARESLHRIAKLFDTGEGEPVYFGSHRRAQGVIVPVELWERLLEQAEDDVDVALVRERLSGDAGPELGRAELDAAFERAADAARRRPA